MLLHLVLILPPTVLFISVAGSYPPSAPRLFVLWLCLALPLLSLPLTFFQIRFHSGTDFLEFSGLLAGLSLGPVNFFVSPPVLSSLPFVPLHPVT